MSEQPNNEPVFPVSTIDGFTNEGMTLRDWFAGQALAGGLHGIPIISADECENVPRRCYMMADAMLAERMKP